MLKSYADETRHQFASVIKEIIEDILCWPLANSPAIAFEPGRRQTGISITELALAGK
jgi:hypothetical protein